MNKVDPKRRKVSNDVVDSKGREASRNIVDSKYWKTRLKSKKNTSVVNRANKSNGTADCYLATFIVFYLFLQLTIYLESISFIHGIRIFFGGGGSYIWFLRQPNRCIKKKEDNLVGHV